MQQISQVGGHAVDVSTTEHLIIHLYTVSDAGATVVQHWMNNTVSVY